MRVTWEHVTADGARQEHSPQLGKHRDASVAGAHESGGEMRSEESQVLTCRAS